MQHIEDALENQQNRRIAIAVVAIIATYVIVVYGFHYNLSITPGFQGMQNGIYGYQVQGKAARSLGESLSPRTGACAYRWLASPTIGSASIQVETSGTFGLDCSFPHRDTLAIDAQTNPVSTQNPYLVGQKVNYYVKVPNAQNNYMHVVGQVNVYTYNIDLSIQSNSEGRWDFGGDTAWFNLLSQTWNQASSDPSDSSISGNAFEAPLYGVVADVRWQNQGSNSLSSSLIGSPLSFYSTPTTTSQTLATLANPTTTNVNTTLSSIYAPDTRMQRLVYYPVSLVQFKANTGFTGDCTFGCSYPSVSMTITLHTLQIGEYILTNPDTTKLAGRTQACTGLGCISELFNGLGEWFSSPFNQLLALFGAGVALVILLAIFATPVVVALIYYFSKRKTT